MNKEDAPVVVEITSAMPDEKLHRTTAWGSDASWMVQDDLIIIQVTGDQTFTKVIRADRLIALEITRNPPPA